jgi:hypothetical protein
MTTMDLLSEAADFTNNAAPIAMGSEPPEDVEEVNELTTEEEDVYKELNIITVPAEARKFMQDKRILPLIPVYGTGPKQLNTG